MAKGWIVTVWIETDEDLDAKGILEETRKIYRRSAETPKGYKLNLITVYTPKRDGYQVLEEGETI